MNFTTEPIRNHVPSFRRWAIWVGGLLALFFAFKTLTTIHLTSLWQDELRSVEKSFQNSLLLIFHVLRQDVHPPFYYVALWMTGQVFGKSAIVLRGFSFVFYILTAISLAFACWTWGRSRLAVAIAALLAVALPFTIRYAVEGKGYTLLTFTICLAILHRLRLLRGQSSAAIPCMLCWSAAALTHYYGMGLLLIQSLFDWHRGFRSWRALAWALVLPTAWMAVNLPLLLGSSGREWIPPSGLWLLRDTLKLALGTQWAVCLALISALALLMSRRSIGMKLKMTDLAVDWGLDAGLLLVALTALISTVRPSAFPRYYIVLIPGCLGVCACWLGLVLETSSPPAWRRPWMEAFLLAALLSLFWTSGYEQINPPPQLGATRDGTDFRSLSLMAAPETFKFTTVFQCGLLNSYDELLRQERLGSARSSWQCWPQSSADGSPSTSELIDALKPPTLVIGSVPLHWRRQIEQEHLQTLHQHLERIGYRCHLDPRSTRAASLEVCQIGSS